MIKDLLLAVSAGHYLVAILVVLLSTVWVSRIRQHFEKSVDVPAIGYGSVPYIGSWQGAVAFTLNPRAYIQRGYEKYRSGIFKISTLQREHIIVCDQKKILEYISAPDDVMSIEGALEQDIQGRWTISYGLWDHLFHIPFIRSRLAPNLVNRFAGMQEEISLSLDTFIGDPLGKVHRNRSHSIC
jgi:hypothetical protein